MRGGLTGVLLHRARSTTLEGIMRTLAMSFVAVLITAGLAHAQAVRGTVMTRDSMRVPGVIITLIDANGTAVARALADDEGRFTMRAPSTGTYYIDARRLAFRPTIDVSIALEEGKILLHTLVLTGAPIELTRVHVTAPQACATESDTASSALAVWKEARKALMASQLTRLTRAYRVDVTTYVRRQPAGVERPQVDSTQQFGMPIRPFTSRSAQELADLGYVTRSDRREVFHAPDEDVLLSESFASTHCLRVLPDSGSGDDIVRLGFTPIPGRRQADITGVLSIHRMSSELRRLDFVYTNLPPRDVVGSSGGEIFFRRLPEGSWLIDRWAIWLPISELRVEPGTLTPAPPTQRPTRQQQPNVAARVGLQTTGGHVTRVAYGSVTVWSKEPPSPKP